MIGPQDTAQIEVYLPREATAPGRSSRESSTAKLAKFFPDSTPLRIAVSLTRVDGKGALARESTVIELVPRTKYSSLQPCPWSLPTSCDCGIPTVRWTSKPASWP